MGKKLAALLLAGCLLLATAGCGAKDVLEDVGTEIKADGRAHGQTTSHSEGETAKTAFVEYTVNSARMEPELEDYTPTDPNHTFVVVNITVKNTFEDDAKIPMFYTDFTLTWDGMGDTTVYPESEFAEGQLPDEYELFKGESRTGDLIFVAPADAKGFSLRYIEVWDDDFEGNSYFIPFSVG